ncbi:hypothetical protein AVEN_25862-1 [Araneus ventricosus]|uniref:Uncharacterized protein n=1 Tax=Araneus ventricosus TaxID=182803 RepID=A0A4Y2U6M8_ARAVE|nr:hypothetical protein AVEN_25862-1 [Araneus ventricosus]
MDSESLVSPAVWFNILQLRISYFLLIQDVFTVKELAPRFITKVINRLVYQQSGEWLKADGPQKQLGFPQADYRLCRSLIFLYAQRIYFNGKRTVPAYH